MGLTPIMDRLAAEIERVETETGAPPRLIELTPRVWYRFLMEIRDVRTAVALIDVSEFLGVPMRKARGSWCCRSCGAEREQANRCGFCLQPYDRITLDDKVLDVCL